MNQPTEPPTIGHPITLGRHEWHRKPGGFWYGYTTTHGLVRIVAEEAILGQALNRISVLENQ